MRPIKTLKRPAWELVFFLLFAAAAALSLWKCPFGYISDEAFYLTVPHRLSMGDVLFADEWHVSQMSGLLTLPLVWLYRTVTGSTDGIVLAARYAYVLFHALASLFFYLRVRRCGPLSAAAALSWFLFTPYDIMALSYNTMAMEGILLSSVLLVTGETRRSWVLSGLLFAAAVLCCPHFAAAWFLCAAAVGIRALWSKRTPAARSGTGSVLAPAHFLWLTVGVSIAAFLFLLYVLCTCGIRGVLDNLPYILSDPEHHGVSPLEKLRHGWSTLAGCHPLFRFVLIGFLVLLLAMLADRGRNRRRAAYLTASCLLTLAGYALFWTDPLNTYYNAVMLPMFFVGLTSFLLCRERLWGLFITLFLGGVLYAAALTLGSNNYFYAISMACALTNAASLLFLGQLLREMALEQNAPPSRLRRAAALAAAFTVTVLLLFQVYVKANHCFKDDSPPALTYLLEAGPGRGIRTTERPARVYNQLERELQIYRSLPQGKLLILNERSWCSLAVDPMEYAGFSAWIGAEDQAALDRLECYYRLNPDKVPDYIFLSKQNLFDDPAAILQAAQAQGYTLTESEFSWYLERT